MRAEGKELELVIPSLCYFPYTMSTQFFCGGSGSTATLLFLPSVSSQVFPE
jgi:hypothetical protein